MDLTYSTDCIEGPSVTPHDATFFECEQGRGTVKLTDREVNKELPPFTTAQDETAYQYKTSSEDSTFDKKTSNIPEKQIRNSQVSRLGLKGTDEYEETMPCGKATEVPRDSSGDMDFSVVPQRFEKTSPSALVDASCNDVPKSILKTQCEGRLCGFSFPVLQEDRANDHFGKGFESVSMDWPTIGVKSLDRGLPRNTSETVDFFTLAIQTGVLTEEDALKIRGKSELKLIERRKEDDVSCARDDPIVASAEVCLKSILKTPNNLGNPQRKTSATVCFASPLMSVSVIEETGEDQCSEETVILSPEDIVMDCQEVPEFYEDLTEKQHQEPPPEKKMRLDEDLKLYHGVDNGSVMLRPSELSTKQGNAIVVHQAESLIPTRTEMNTGQVVDHGHASRNMNANAPHNVPEVQVVPEHLSKRTIPPQKTMSYVQLGSCPSFLRLDETAFLEEEDDAPPCQHLECVPRLQDILDTDASFYTEDLTVVDTSSFNSAFASFGPLEHLCSEFKGMDFESLPCSKEVDFFQKEMIEEASDSQLSGSWITTSQVHTTEDVTSEATVISTASSAITVSSQYFDCTERNDKFRAQMPEMKSDSDKITDPEIVIQVPLTVPGKVTEQSRPPRPMTMNEQNFHKLLYRCSSANHPVVSIERAAVLSTSSTAENTTKQRKHEVEITPEMKQDPAPTPEDDTLSMSSEVTILAPRHEQTLVSDSEASGNRVEHMKASEQDDSRDKIIPSPSAQQLLVTSADHVVLSSEILVPAVSGRYECKECGEHSVSDSQTSGGNVQCIEPSEHNESPEDKECPNTTRYPPVQQPCSTPDLDDMLLSPKWTRVPGCYQSSECEEHSGSDSQKLESDVQCIESSGHDALKYEVTSRTKQGPLCLTPDDKAVLLPSKKTVLLSTFCHDKKYNENSNNGSQSMQGSCVDSIEPSGQHDDSDDKVSPSMKHDTPVTQLCVTPEVVPASRSYQPDGECEEHSVISASPMCATCVPHNEHDKPRQTLEEAFVTQEKGYKNAQEAFSQMDIDLDGPELLEFAMLLVKGAFHKTQTEQPNKDKNAKFLVKAPSAFQWQGKSNYKHLVSETNSVEGETCAVLGHLAGQENPCTGEETRSPQSKMPIHSSRPRRVGLSRRQKVKPLHPYLTKLGHRASLKTSDD